MSLAGHSRRRIGRWCIGGAVVLVLIGSLRIGSTWMVFSAAIDEPAHLGAGMEWLGGKYRSDDHPPLARVFGALGPYLAGERWHGDPICWFEGFRILGKRPHYDSVLALGRMGTLPFFWVGAAAVFLWARRAGGSLAGLMATLMFTTTPPVLAHSGLITTDMALAAFVAAAGVQALYWAERPNRNRTLLFGLLIGLAVLSKASALGFLPAAWGLMYGFHCFRQRPDGGQMAADLKRRLGPALAALAVALLVLWAGYKFTFARVDYLGLRLPAPHYFTGLRYQWEHNLQGHGAYLLGRTSPTGFWYYYPVVLAVKTPLAMLLLAAWSAWLLWRYRSRTGYGLALAFAAGILLVGLASRINIGVRHVLPVYAGLSVACGGGAALLLGKHGRHPAGVAMLSVLLGWHALSGAVCHPDYLAYTNELAGAEPERILADSDLDWGQDMKRLGEFLKAQRAAEVTFMPFNTSYLDADPSFPRVLPMDPARPATGWNAVSASTWKLWNFRTSGVTWPDRIKPNMRIGRSILLWHFPTNHVANPTQ